MSTLSPAPSFTFGLDIIPESPIAFGARAIVESVSRPVLTPTGRPKVANRRPVTISGYRFALLGDRCGSRTPGHLSPAAREALSGLTAAYVSQLEAHHEKTGDRDFALSGMGVQAHARVSGGYAYLGVAVQPDQEGWQGGQWSGSGAIPAAGEDVTVTINRIGPALVLRRVLVHGYTGLLVLPLSPPDWYRSQNGAHAPCTVFGAEIA
jgi:hypothetical protein